MGRDRILGMSDIPSGSFHRGRIFDTADARISGVVSKSQKKKFYVDIAVGFLKILFSHKFNNHHLQL